MKRVIVAGNRRQFLNWCHENSVNPNTVVYVSNGDNIRGMRIRNKDIIRIGTFYERPDIDVIEQVLLASRED